MKGYKIRLFPTEGQEQLFKKSIGCSRYVYNWGLSTKEKIYKEEGKKLSIIDLGKLLTQHKKEDGYEWLTEPSSATLKEALRDLGRAYTNFFEGRTKKPKFKSKKKAKMKFYCRYDRIYFLTDTVNVDKVGKVKYQSSYNVDFTKISSFSNPRIEYIHGKWVLSFGVKEVVDVVDCTLTDVSLGVDLGIKMLAYCSDKNLNAKNINKSIEVRRLKKKYKRLQKQCSRKYEMNKKGNIYIKTNNIIKLEKKLRKIQDRLNNIRTNHLHQVTTKMVKTKPYRIVIEDLNVRGMLKNKYLAKAIQEQSFNRFRQLLTYKCKKYGIELVIADRWYASSKICSSCGTKNTYLKLKDRLFKCVNERCNAIIDRDYNASINLSKYGLV